MSHNRWWQILLCMIAIGALWFTIPTVYHLYIYAKLNAQTTTNSIEWSVKEITDEHYLPHAKYTFTVNGLGHEGETTLTFPPYRNGWAAEQAIAEHAKHPWDVYFSPSDPQYSSLQKSLPFKECLSTAFLWGLLLYFIGLKYYVVNKYGRNHS